MSGQLHDTTVLPSEREYLHPTLQAILSFRILEITSFITEVSNSCGAKPVSSSTADRIVAITYSVVL
jgi:hypothetical protein